MQPQSPHQDRTGNLPFYKTLEDFYNARPPQMRQYSGEADYGVHWNCPPWSSRWRVSYVHNTGELYAVRLEGNDGPVLVLGILPPDPIQDERRETYYKTLDRVLEGWPEACNEERKQGRSGIAWILNRLETCPSYRRIVQVGENEMSLRQIP